MKKRLLVVFTFAVILLSVWAFSDIFAEDEDIIEGTIQSLSFAVGVAKGKLHPVSKEDPVAAAREKVFVVLTTSDSEW